jgi:type III pantothenate kinase
MLLAVDTGNTNIVIGLFDGDRLTGRMRLATDTRRTRDEYTYFLRKFLDDNGTAPEKVVSAAVSSVVPQTDHTITSLIKTCFGIEPFFITHTVKLNIRIRYDNPGEVGADRIVNSAAAFHLFGGDLIVIDFGTATTAEYLTKDGTYSGGVIIPGFQLMKDSLHVRTSKLPDVEIRKPVSVLGTNTIQSIQNGLYHLSVGGLKYIIDRIHAEYSPAARVIATGGLASLIHDDLPPQSVIEPDLTLIGLNYLFRLNHE